MDRFWSDSKAGEGNPEKLQSRRPDEARRFNSSSTRWMQPSPAKNSTKRKGTYTHVQLEEREHKLASHKQKRKHPLTCILTRCAIQQTLNRPGECRKQCTPRDCQPVLHAGRPHIPSTMPRGTVPNPAGCWPLWHT